MCGRHARVITELFTPFLWLVLTPNFSNAYHHALMGKSVLLEVFMQQGVQDFEVGGDLRSSLGYLAF